MAETPMFKYHWVAIKRQARAADHGSAIWVYIATHCKRKVSVDVLYPTTVHYTSGQESTSCCNMSRPYSWERLPVD